MKNSRHLFRNGALLIAFAVRCESHSASGQPRQGAGKSIGSVTTQGNLIVITLDQGALGKANLFDLVRHTLRFTPDTGGYRAENLAFQWDAEFGAALVGSEVTPHNFAFPFSGKSWDSFSVGPTGSIRFGAAQGRGGDSGAGGGRGGGVSIGRFDQLQDAARSLINTVPAICVFFKPRMSGTRYVKELPDRVVITWDVTEPAGNIQDFTWVPTVNRFQAILRGDGSIEMSYDQLAAKDAIVGLYPIVTGGAEQALATLKGEEHPTVDPHLDIQNVKLAWVDGLLLKFSFATS